MAENIPPRERSKRGLQKKIYKDFVCEKEKKNSNKNKNKCNGCNDVFEDKKTMLHHQAICMTTSIDLSKPQSFLAEHYRNKPQAQQEEEDGQDKVLPQSQPLDSGSTSLPPTDDAVETAHQSITAVTPSVSDNQDNGPEQPVVMVEDINPVEELVFMEPIIQANLPPYLKVTTANSDYNNMDKITFAMTVNVIFEDTIHWKKNLFLVPSGKPGNDFLELYVDWLKKFNTNSSFQHLAMKVVNILPNMLLQKPSATSKAKDHFTALEQRLQMWKDGKIKELWNDNRVIQKKLSVKPKKSSHDITRVVSKLMFEGKVGAAMKFLDENADNTVLHPTPQVVEKLKTLHPEPAEIFSETLIQGPLNRVSTAHFNNITEQEIMNAARQTKGSGGPSMMDGKQWRRLLCSSHFKAKAKELRTELAIFARKLATEIIDPSTLEGYNICRLITLDKDPGSAELSIRPIGVGEVIRRIVGKTIIWSLSGEIQEAAGPLQVASGLKGGAEAAIHGMKIKFEEEASDGIILVDAENAFNRLNRLAALHNIQYICPPFATVLINTYRTPARLILVGGGEIESSEGTTQGCTLAMGFYALGTNPILQKLKSQVKSISQVWLADDATGVGKLNPLKVWWDLIKKEGVKYGYFVKPSKSWLILKDSEKLDECKELFKQSPINITVEGKRHLGAAIGSSDYKNHYIDEKVNKWVSNIKSLSEIAKTQPHVAYAAFIHGEQHKYTYFLRTIAGISENLKPLDDAINEVLIPALFGSDLTPNEREILTLPTKNGGLGLRKVADYADISYEASTSINQPLITQILTQSNILPEENKVKEVKSAALLAYKAKIDEKHDNVKNSQDANMQRSIEQLSEPGASSWLGALPLQEQGFNLTKGEFQDALALRYNKTVKNLPSKCPCGSAFTVTHALDCHLGGFVNARHDNIRDVECSLLKSVVHDVEREPPLQPVTNKVGYQKTAILADDARTDIRARGFWRDGQNAYFDIRVTNVDCASQQSSSLKSVLRKHEMEKKRNYNRRIMEVEHGTFTPLVFSTSGVMAHECSAYHKTLAEKLANKKNERYEEVMRYLRVKFSFLALKSTLLCLRGSRTISKVPEAASDFSLALNELGM